MKSQETKKKILYVITQGEWGGAQRYVFDLATGLANNWDITIAIGEPLGKKDLQEKLRITNYPPSPIRATDGQSELRIKVIQLRYLVRRISLFHDVLAIFELVRLYQKLKPDVVHLNSSKAGIIGSIAKLFVRNSKFVIRNSKLIYTVHGWVFNEPVGYLKNSLYRLLEKLTAKLKDKIIVLSENDFQSGLKNGIDESRLVKIPLGITTSTHFDKQNARELLSKITNYESRKTQTYPFRGITNFIVGTIANLYPTKGIDILIQAVKKLKELTNIENIKFIIIGEGEEREKLQSLILKNNLQNNVFLLGAIENAKNYLPALDLFILSSRKEGLPYTIIEAMTQAVPVITTNVGGIPSLIDNTNGLSINPDDAEQLTNSIIWAIENPNEMKKRAERALEKIKEFALDKMLTETENLYN